MKQVLSTVTVLSIAVLASAGVLSAQVRHGRVALPESSIERPGGRRRPGAYQPISASFKNDSARAFFSNLLNAG